MIGRNARNTPVEDTQDGAGFATGLEDLHGPGLDLSALLSSLAGSIEPRAAAVHDTIFGAFLAVPQPPSLAPAPVQDQAASAPLPALAEVLQLDDAALESARGGPGGGGGGGGSGGTLSTYTTSVSAYNVTLNFSGTWSLELQQAFTSSADRLAGIIVGDVQDAAIRSRGKTVVIDDIVISAELGSIDGVGGILGQAGPTALRSGGSNPFLPATATMRFDSADAQALSTQGSFDEVVLHEMFHCVGFGTIWGNLGLVSGNGYVGANAVAAYATILGQSAASVPLETTGGTGTAGSHWSEAVFGNELMTGYLNSDFSAATPNDNALSLVSMASLADLGYQLAGNLAQLADPYVLPA